MVRIFLRLVSQSIANCPKVPNYRQTRSYGEALTKPPRKFRLADKPPITADWGAIPVCKQLYYRGFRFIILWSLEPGSCSLGVEILPLPPGIPSARFLCPSVSGFAFSS